MLALAVAPAAGQRLSARGPQPAVVKLGGESTLVLVLDGIRGEAELAAVPTTPELDVRIGTPITRASAGAQTRSVSWTITFVPRREDTFDLPAFEVRADGQTFAAPPLQLACVREIVGERYAFLELACQRPAVFEREVLRLQIRFGFDQEFLRTNVLQLFPRALDVQAQVLAPWIQALPGTLAIGGDPLLEGEARDVVTVALDDELASAVRLPDLQREGRPFSVFAIERSYLVERSGELTIPPPLLRFACATQFRDGAFTQAVATDWQLAFVQGQPLTVQVAPLPEEGRPPGFTGAVGRFTVSAEVAPRELEVGGTLRLTLRIAREGAEGNLEFFDPPRFALDRLFHVNGWADRKGSGQKESGQRAIAYDLVALEPLEELPPFPFSFFDPSEPAGYRTIETQPLPLRVRAREDAQVPEPDKAPSPSNPPSDTAQAPARAGERDDASPRRPIFAIGVGLALAGAALLVAVAIRRRIAR
jgi:oxygen tolerance protein BatD